MTITQDDIIFASLMGVRSFQTFSALQNELSKHVLPAIPFLPAQNRESVPEMVPQGLDARIWSDLEGISEQEQFFPLSFSFTDNGVRWLFPYEPMISVSGGNVIAKRNVAKQGTTLRGSIKERWAEKDHDITITGILVGSLMKGKPEECYPRRQMETLLEYLRKAQALFVHCHALEVHGINRVVVEDYNFPFTKGENVQAFEIKAVSDFYHELLITR